LIEVFLFILGFDFGVKYFGVAVGQSLTFSVSPLFSLLIKSDKFFYFDIFSILSFWNPKIVIVGYPISDIYDNSFLLNKIDSFVFELRLRYNIPILLINEHLSTWEARKFISTYDFYFNNYCFFSLNAIAASILIRQWLVDSFY
jgi:putative Holliday junction resolvase